MKVSYQWLRAYADRIPPASELSHMLTMCGLEVEGIQPRHTALDGTVVGFVEKTRPHPNADRLTLCQVNLGDGPSVQIVCGAPNVAAGQNVAVARPGATVSMAGPAADRSPVAIKIRRTRLRGQVSEGMICAEDELGLSDEHAGIMVLRDDAPTGQPLEEYLSAHGIAATDTVYDLAITPNRPDAVCHIGVARDIAACCGSDLRRPNVALPAAGGPVADAISVHITCPAACRRYVALLVRGVRIGPSPLWLRQRLHAIGQRPINNVVDVTNYVMRECGQPLHAFDFDRLLGASVIVRQATAAEHFVTLDGKQHALPAGAVLVCDAERPIALGGIMGGANSEVFPATVNVLLESAYFDPATTRRTVKALGIVTDASYRFERGVDASGQIWAAARAAQLMVQLSGGELVPGMVDCHPNPVFMSTAALRPTRLAHVLGADIAREEVLRILDSLGFSCRQDDGHTLYYDIPPFRPDVTREIDLIEEVARIHGFDAIHEPGRVPIPNFVPRTRASDRVRASAKTFLVGRGYREIYTNSLLSREEAERFCCPALGAAGPVVETLNAVSQSMTTLRPSLLAGMLLTMGFNSRRGCERLRFCEFGHVFHRAEAEDALVPGYAEHESFIMAISGPVTRKGWDQTARLADFFDLKGDVEALLRALRLPDFDMTASEHSTTVSEFHVSIGVKGRRIGHMAQVLSTHLQAQDIRTAVYFAELDWDALTSLASPHQTREYMAVPRHPEVMRDIALVVPRGVTAGAMLKSIGQAGAPLLQQAEIFDLYEGEHIGRDHKSIAFSLRLGADRTLTDAEVRACIGAILDALERNWGARLRQA